MKKITIIVVLVLFLVTHSKYRYLSHSKLKNRKSNNGHNNSSKSKGTIVNNQNDKRMKKEGEELGTPFKFPETFAEITEILGGPMREFKMDRLEFE